MNLLYVINALRRSRARKAERVMFDRLEYEFHQPHNGSWTDEQPDPSDDSGSDRGECAA